MNYQSRATLLLIALLSGCGSKNTSTGTSTDTSTITSSGSTSASGSLAVTQFSPAAGSVNAIPTSIILTFNETNLDLSTDANSATNPSNYVFNCGGSDYFATTATSSVAGTVIVTMPSVSVANGTSCTLIASSEIQDTSGNWLSSSQSAVYTLSTSVTGTTPLTISSFSPPTETVSSMPTQVSVTFSESSLDTSNSGSVLSIANYSYNCGGTVYSPSSVTLTGSGVVAVSLPTVTVSAGSSCVLTVSNNVLDGSGNALSGTAQATYTQSSSSSSTWNEQATATMTASYGNAYTGSGWYDVAGNGIVMTGLWVHSGAYVDQITGLWTNGFSSSTLIYGPAYGGPGGAIDPILQCPANMRLTGLFGTYDNQIDSVGIICQTQDGTQSYQSSAYGGNGQNSFEMNCPTGRFATDFTGLAGTYVQDLQLGCR